MLFGLFILYLKSKEIFSIVVANIANELTESLNVCRIFTVLYPAADNITENATEVLVSRVRSKAS